MLRPLPHRGDVVAAGAVALAALVVLLQVRFDDVWADGVHLAYAALAAAFVGTLALRSPREGPDPRAYQSALLASTLAIAATAVFRFASVVGEGGLDSGGTLFWMAGTLALLGLGLARARNSALCLLLGAASLVVAVVAAVQWIFSPDGVEPFRWVLLAITAVFALATVAVRDRAPARAVALADAGGLAALALALTFGLEVSFGDEGPPSPGAGWEMFLFACGFGLCAYSAVDRVPGPGWIGTLVLIVTALIASEGDKTVIGWPLVLAIGAGALLVIGLRPSRPLPPAPTDGEADVLDLRVDRPPSAAGPGTQPPGGETPWA
jgi:hypothetical protein